MNAGLPLLIAFLFAFLFLLAFLGFVAWRVLGAKDAQGNRTAPGCLLGGATGLALGCLGLLGVAAFIAAVAAISGARSAHEFIRTRGDVKVGVIRDAAQRIHHDPARPLHLLLEWKGHTEPTEPMVRELTELCRETDVKMWMDYGVDETGKEVTRTDFALPAGERDLRELERLLREKLPELSLEQGVEVHLRSTELEGEVR